MITHMYTKENLNRLKRMDSLAPQVMKAFWAFDKAAVAEGAIPVKAENQRKTSHFHERKQP